MPPQKDPPRLTRGLTSRNINLTGEKGSGGLGGSVGTNGNNKQSDEFARNIKILIETNDTNEKKQCQDQLLDSLKLTKQSCGDISRVYDELLQLGYAGLTDTQQVFAMAVNYAVTQPENDESGKIFLANRRVLFEEEEGRNILRRIIWCTSHDDPEISATSSSAVSTLCGSFQGQ
jgi:hypothetical protein